MTGALIVTTEPFLNEQRGQLIALAACNALPVLLQRTAATPVVGGSEGKRGWLAMEILDLKFGGISVGTWLVIAVVLLACKKLYDGFEDWKEHRNWKKQYKAKKKIWDEQHRWQPKIVTGIDCGEWVRKDGRPLDEAEWNQLVDRLEKKGPR